MALYVATKARILVTVAAAGAMVAGVAGLQAQAIAASIPADPAATSQTTVTAAPAPAPTPTATAKKHKKKKKPAPVVVAAPVVKKAPASHASSGGSKKP
jgi:hypothetical protein